MANQSTPPTSPRSPSAHADKPANAKSPSESLVHMTEMILPQHTNPLGTAFGGVIMSWVDIAASICASRHAGKPVVTASVDTLSFLAPVKLGWFVSLQASINHSWNTSMEIGVKVMAENTFAQEKFHTASAYLTMVCLDSTGRPAPVPPLFPETADEIRRFEEAQIRREIRLKHKRSIQEKREARKNNSHTQ